VMALYFDPAELVANAAAASRGSERLSPYGR
jgi:hypothetical protein